MVSILPLYSTGKTGSTLIRHLEDLLLSAEDLSRRLRGTCYAHVAELAMSLVGLVHRIRQGPSRPDNKDLELLPKLSLAIERAFNPAEKADVAIKISEMVDRRASRS
ncbi:MAG: Response regulator consisting of a CheY-like receiver domain [Rhodospirillaceae bacterium]|nr:MAG: Response regulator consisting of a CheY-like receiver domain [Rhodospirillaceae bacterium]